MWSAPRRTSRGGQRRYSDLAIETCLTLRTAYRLPLRQTQGLMGSIGTLMGLDIRVPDYSTLSRRANGLSIAQVMRQAGSVPVHLVVDSTGLKILGEGEWLAQKHKTKGIRRRWRKLHLGLDLASGAIVCANLTHDDVGDSTALPGLLVQLDAPVTGFLADGAYDGASTRDLLRERYGETLGCGYTAAKERSDPPAIGAGSNRSGSPYCPDPQQWPYGLAGGHRVQPAQPDRKADRPLEGCHRPQTPIPQLLQADHGDPGRPESPEHNDRTRTACVRTHRLTLPLGKGRIPSPPRSMQQRLFHPRICRLPAAPPPHYRLRGSERVGARRCWRPPQPPSAASSSSSPPISGTLTPAKPTPGPRVGSPSRSRFRFFEIFGMRD